MRGEGRKGTRLRVPISGAPFPFPLIHPLAGGGKKREASLRQSGTRCARADIWHA
jgi:hypothetical protein